MDFFTDACSDSCWETACGFVQSLRITTFLLSSAAGGLGYQHSAYVCANSAGCHTPVRLLGSAQWRPLAHEWTPKSSKIILQGSFPRTGTALGIHHKNKTFSGLFRTVVLTGHGFQIGQVIQNFWDGHWIKNVTEVFLYQRFPLKQLCCINKHLSFAA